MLSAIKLDHQPALQADEINDVGAYWLLPPKFAFQQLAVT